MTKPNNHKNSDDPNNPIERDCFPYSDPLLQSSEGNLRFPTEAAARLSEQRKERYDVLTESVDEVELRLRVFASIMGLYTTNDETPSAA